MITSPNLGALDYLRALGVQVLWIAILFTFCRWFYQRAFNVLTVSGG
jgi:ABC-type uncharacterized transport system permease subunit